MGKRLLGGIGKRHHPGVSHRRRQLRLSLIVVLNVTVSGRPDTGSVASCQQLLHFPQAAISKSEVHLPPRQTVLSQPQTPVFHPQFDRVKRLSRQGVRRGIYSATRRKQRRE